MNAISSEISDKGWLGNSCDAEYNGLIIETN